MIVIRSFDVNKPGEDVETLKGGVRVVPFLRVCWKSEEIEVRPGIVAKDVSTGRLKNTPIFATVVSLYAEKNPLQYAVPGDWSVSVLVSIPLWHAIVLWDK